MNTMELARNQYFRDNGFPADGGVDDAWVDFKLGPVPLPFPNTAGRKVAVRFHDLHHVLTGYRTDLKGEFEISAWELGGGCKRMAAAWGLNLLGLVGGVAVAPRRTFRAFLRGRRSDTLYGREYAALLKQTVEETRAQVGLDGPATPTTAADVSWFLLSVAAGLGLGAVVLAVVLTPVTPIAWAVGLWVRHRHLARGHGAPASPPA